ncbi:GCN5 family N-acetyltransferase [Virgisporangium aliadipatigenens]|uniref:GCN5 family N-acetyltransferase n=1 Tax=Virgisporangium aliadipatigenens TaxID=741659 RepID=A0A8J4DW19_9ACTN|nr:GNAT family N-acetyltransferase [Virgisporangium aliadipatigenens]GIJ51763.1 GCN5 family N-acetyltransferase [Virgisporangium aliadipatigenens]
MNIRGARADELELLRDIERAAGECFRAVGMPEIADDEPFPVAQLAGYQRDGRAWVSVDDADRPVAYLLADEIDGALHIEQVSVHPDAARRRLGRGLIEHAAGVAAAGGLPALTLTTFIEIPWNAPYYARLGFVPVPDAELTPGLRALRRHEAEIGLDRWPRTAMRRPVTPAAGSGDLSRL